MHPCPSAGARPRWAEWAHRASIFASAPTAAAEAAANKTHPRNGSSVPATQNGVDGAALLPGWARESLQTRQPKPDA